MFSHPRLSLPNDLFPVSLPVKILKALLPSSILATWYAHLHFLDLITLIIIGEWYKLWSSSWWGLLYSPFSSLLDPNTRLRILFSNTLSLRFSLNVSQTYIWTGNVTVRVYFTYPWSRNGINRKYRHLIIYRYIMSLHMNKWK